MATTNIESSLDSALFRRFDDCFAVPLPGPDEIKRLLRTTLCAVKVAEPEDLARELAGSTAAMVVKTAQDAAKAAVLVGGQFVTQGHLEQAVAELRKNDRLAKEI